MAGARTNSQVPAAPELLEQRFHPAKYHERNNITTIPPIQKLGSIPPFFEYSYSSIDSFTGHPSNAPTPPAAIPFDFSFSRNSSFPSTEHPPERPSSYSQPNKRRKIAPCGSPVPSTPSECCSSCSDGMPCVDPDCDAEEEGQPCADPNCDIALEEVIICSGDGDCSIPVCKSQCVELPKAQTSLLGAGNWVENQVYDYKTLDGLSRPNYQFSSGILQSLQTLQSSSVSPAPTTPSMNNNLQTAYSPHVELQTPHDALSTRPNYLNQPGEILSDSRELPQSAIPLENAPPSAGNIFIQPWNSNGDKSAMFCCPWDGCNQPLESEEWMSHFHQVHVDPQMTFYCPFQEETCPPSMDTNPLAHLESDHGYIFDSNGNGYSCPSPTCPPDLTFCDPSTLHNHLDYAHATPGSGALRCRLNSCDNWFEDSNQLVSHVNQYHPLTALVSRDEGIHLSEPIREPTTLKNDPKLQIPSNESKQPLADTEEPVVNDSEHIGNDLVHSCKWKLTDGTVCQEFCDSEIDLQKHIKAAHLEPLDYKTGYYCHWEGCMRESKLGAKAGFSQRGKLERHMATHTNFKCSKCDICGKDFSAPQAMKQHRRLHTGERPWKCKHCDKTFAQQSACTVHERTHTNEKPLECPICHKKFSESSNLAKHRKTHGEKGNHACTIPGCDKSYHRFDQLKRHMLTHAKGGESGTVSEEGSDSQGEEEL